MADPFKCQTALKEKIRHIGLMGFLKYFDVYLARKATSADKPKVTSSCFVVVSTKMPVAK